MAMVMKMPTNQATMKKTDVRGPTMITGATDMPTIFYAIPLSLSISLVYNATRYELPERIFRAAATMFVKILVGMTVIYGLLTFFSS